MFRYCVVLFALAQFRPMQCLAIGNEVIKDQELILAFVVNRHGERTPDSDELGLSNQKELLKNITYIEGLEGLTNTGKRRAYQIGKFLRQHYGTQGHNIMSNIYLRDEVVIRSTDKERTKMTALVAMAAAYPPEIEQQWDEGVGKVWQPVPYSAVPMSEDYLRYYSNCRRFKNLMAEAKKASMAEELAPYSDLIPLLLKETGHNFTENPVLFETLHDLFKSQLSLGLDIPEWSKPILPRLTDAALLAYKIYFRSEEMKKIGGGVLLDSFLKTAESIASGASVPKLHIFSAHDFNIGSLMAVTRVKGNEKIMPAYGAVFALELYRSRDGEYSVVPVYLEQAGQCASTIMHFEGCSEAFCELSKFKDLTKEYRLPEKEFYQICNIKTEL